MEFFIDERFLTPFLATLGASLTIIALQSIQMDRKEKDKKIYAISYIIDVSYRILTANLILNKHTIIPHIDATKKMIEGDDELLKITFLADEFDILTDQSFDFNLLPEEYKVLLGCNDITLVQTYEILIYMEKNERIRLNFNDFVKQNLKSEHYFKNQPKEKQIDILSNYWDYLDSLKREANRTISFICYLLLPAIDKYLTRKEFLFYSKKNIYMIRKQIDIQLDKFRDIIPKKDSIPKSIEGGIQKIINKNT